MAVCPYDFASDYQAGSTLQAHSGVVEPWRTSEEEFLPPHYNPHDAQEANSLFRNLLFEPNIPEIQVDLLVLLCICKSDNVPTVGAILCFEAFCGAPFHRDPTE